MEGKVGQVSAEKRPVIDFSRSFRVVSALVFHTVMILIMAFDVLFFSIRIRGRKNIRVRKAFLISNHFLYLDGLPVAHTIWPRRAYFSALEETMRIRFLGTFLRLLGVFPLPERNTLKHILTPVGRALEERGFVHFFPEGEMHRFNQRIEKFQEGVFFFSLLKGVPIIPIVLVIKRRRFLGKTLTFLPYRLTVIIGEPVSPESFNKPGMPRKQAVSAMSRHMRHVMQRMIDVEHGVGGQSGNPGGRSAFVDTESDAHEAPSEGSESKLVAV